MREIFVGGAFIRANLSLLPQGFDVGALVSQGLVGSPNYSGFLNNLMILINCEGLKEISAMARGTSTWSSHGQTLKRLPIEEVFLRRRSKESTSLESST